MIDELTGLPTARTGTVPRRPGELGPGAESGFTHHESLGVVCGYLINFECPCGGKWEIWEDGGRRLIVFRHVPPEGKVYARAFDEHRYPRLRGTDDTVDYLTRTIVHPRNEPTPGRAGRR